MIVGVDCGATNLRIGIFGEQGQLLTGHKSSSPLKTTPDQFAKIVKEHLTALTANHPGMVFSALGVATPGPLDLEHGLLLPSSNLANTQPINLKEQFFQEFNVPVFFDKDTNAALLGEVWQGAAVGKSNVVMLTLGSGVGGAIMINGQIEHGANGRAGEIGHIFMEVQGQNENMPRCGLGHRGCFEALVNSAKSMDELGTYLGYGLVNIVNIFNPEMVVVGGGKIFMGNFLPKAIGVLKEKGVKSVIDKVEVVYAKLKDESGVFGAGKMALDAK